MKWISRIKLPSNPKKEITIKTMEELTHFIENIPKTKVVIKLDCTEENLYRAAITTFSYMKWQNIESLIVITKAPFDAEEDRMNAERSFKSDHNTISSELSRESRTISVIDSKDTTPQNSVTQSCTKETKSESISSLKDEIGLSKENKTKDAYCMIQSLRRAVPLQVGVKCYQGTKLIHQRKGRDGCLAPFF